MRCFYVLKKWFSAKLSLNRDLSLNKMSLNRDCTVHSNLVIRNFLVTLKLFLNAKCSLSLWSKLTIGHRKWFLNTNLFVIKTFHISKFDCTSKLIFNFVQKPYRPLSTGTYSYLLVWTFLSWLKIAQLFEHNPLKGSIKNQIWSP